MNNTVLATRRRIDDENFEILQPHDVSSLDRINYTVVQLKRMASHYNIKKTGTKNVLISRIRSKLIQLDPKIPVQTKRNLSPTSSAIIIQKNVRRYLTRASIAYRGPAVLRRSLCTNLTDFISWENVDAIPIVDFYSYTDKNKFTYGFDIHSLIEYRTRQPNQWVNPYNRKRMPKFVGKYIDKLRRSSSMIRAAASTNIPIEPNEIRANRLFRLVSQYTSHNVNPEWFLSISQIGVLRIFIVELTDILSHRMRLSREMQEATIPSVQYHNTLNTPIDELSLPATQTYALDVINMFISAGSSQERREAGAYYVLMALTIVSMDARRTHTHIYDIVSHD